MEILILTVVWALIMVGLIKWSATETERRNSGKEPTDLDDVDYAILDMTIMDDDWD